MKKFKKINQVVKCMSKPNISTIGIEPQDIYYLSADDGGEEYKNHYVFSLMGDCFLVQKGTPVVDEGDFVHVVDSKGITRHLRLFKKSNRK